MKTLYCLILLIATGCHYKDAKDSIVAIQIQDRNGLTETISTPEKLEKAKHHIAAGLTVREAAARIKVGKTALYNILNQHSKIDGSN